MTKPLRLHELHRQHAAIAANIGPGAMILFERIERACQHVFVQYNSLSCIFGMYGAKPNHELRELYAFLLLRHPELRLTHEQVAQYFYTTVDEVKDYEAGGVLTVMGAVSATECIRLTAACQLLAIKPSDLL